jgi:hypothetical protein
MAGPEKGPEEEMTMSENSTAKRSAALDAFLAEAKAEAKGAIGPNSRSVPVGKGRLIFALDATANRRPTWELDYESPASDV